MFWGHGWLTMESEAVAAYWYNWSAGHPGRFVVKLALFEEDETLFPGVISIAAHVDLNSIQYSILHPEEAV